MSFIVNNRKVPRMLKYKSAQRVRQVRVGMKCYKLYPTVSKTMKMTRDGKRKYFFGTVPTRNTQQRNPNLQKKNGKQVVSYICDSCYPQARVRWYSVATIEKYSSRKTLLLDFDVARPVPRLTPFLARLRVIGLRARWCSYRRTAHGWHVVIAIDVALTPSEQVACQFALGSDPQRETMNTRRAISLRVHRHSAFWKRRWNILFERKL